MRRCERALLRVESGDLNGVVGVAVAEEAGHIQVGGLGPELRAIYAELERTDPETVVARARRAALLVHASHGKVFFTRVRPARHLHCIAVDKELQRRRNVGTPETARAQLTVVGNADCAQVDLQNFRSGARLDDPTQDGLIRDRLRGGGRDIAPADDAGSMGRMGHMGRIGPICRVGIASIELECLAARVRPGCEPDGCGLAGLAPLPQRIPCRLERFERFIFCARVGIAAGWGHVQFQDRGIQRGTSRQKHNNTPSSIHRSSPSITTSACRPAQALTQRCKA